jgi:hypothetical protein
VVLGVFAVALAACTADETPPAFPNATSSPPAVFLEPLPSGTVPAPAVAASPGPMGASGAPGAGCVSGWVTPRPGTRNRDLPLAIIRDRLGVDGGEVVVEMRMFDGPEAPPSDKGYIKTIRRWYVKLAVPGEPGAEGRFLVENRAFGAGLAAVAPFDSTGFISPDWVGFQYDTASPANLYPGLPGRWRGVPYDFVEGGAGLTIRGLPDDVEGCLDAA